MKIAKASVTLKDLEDGLKDELKGSATSEEREEIIKKKYKISKAEYDAIKDKSKNYVMVGVHDKQILHKDDDRVKASFELFGDDEKLKAKMIDPLNIWAYYEFKYEISDEMKSRYEGFVSGFLHYYDTELRNGLSDHTVWCYWEKNAVTVYLFPAPLRHRYTFKETGLTTKWPKEYEDQRVVRNEKLKKNIYKGKWEPPVDGFQSDPPSPSGPPPPEIFQPV